MILMVEHEDHEIQDIQIYSQVQRLFLPLNETEKYLHGEVIVLAE